MQAITTTRRLNTNGNSVIYAKAPGGAVRVPCSYSATREAQHDAAALQLARKLGWSGALICGEPAGKHDTRVYVFANDRAVLIGGTK